MTEENNDTQSTNETSNEKQDQKYGTPLVVLNTLIILCLVILALSYKRDMTKETSEEMASHETTQTQVVGRAVEEGKPESDWVTPHISKQAKIHILYGDETGGAHYHTVTTPCKSLFPEDWDPNKIIDVTEKIAANDNLEWGARKNGNMYAKEIHDGIIVGVIMDPERKYVVTSFPLNATRNPCPTDDEVPAAQTQEQKEDSDESIEVEHKYNHNN